MYQKETEREEVFKTDAKILEDKYRHELKATRLAEHIFNLQSVEGFGKTLEEIKSGKVESLFAELESGGQLFRNNIKFKFIPPSGLKGCDYDIEIINESGENILCEVKNKIESASLEKGSILNPLKNSKAQLPKGKPALIFLKIPEKWVSNPDIKNIVDSAMEDFFRNTERIIAVVFRWELLYKLAQQGVFFPTMFKIYCNKESKFYNSFARKLVSTLENDKDIEWNNFSKISLKHGIYLIDRLMANTNVILGLVNNIPPELITYKPSEDKLSILEIINLLIDTEKEDFKKKLKKVLEKDKEVFFPVNPFKWVKKRKYNQRKLSESIENFIEERQSTLKWFQSLSFPNWDSMATIPSGGKIVEISARRILELWVGNELLMISEIINRMIGFFERKPMEV